MNELLRNVCWENLRSTLEKLKHHSDHNVVEQAQMAEGLLFDLEFFEKTGREAVTAEVGGDDTNYEKYRLLKSYGLSPFQLVLFAKSDGLHYLRIVRMLRLTFELSLDDATKLVDSDI
jgi:hypothetical protein